MKMRYWSLFISAMVVSTVGFAQPKPCDYIDTPNSPNFSTCLSMAESGDTKAQYMVGRAYFRGADAQKGEEFLRKAAFGGNDEAIEVLRSHYFERGRKDPLADDLVKFYEQLVVKLPEKNYRLSLFQIQLCQAYKEGIGVTVDYKKASKWCELAMQNGSGRARDWLISFALNGLGGPKDYKKADALFKDHMDGISDARPEDIVSSLSRYAREGICPADLELSKIYKEGLLKVTPSEEMSKQWAERYKSCLQARM